MATRRRNASKRSVRRRVAKALTKYVRGNPGKRRRAARSELRSQLRREGKSRKHFFAGDSSKASRARRDYYRSASAKRRGGPLPSFGLANPAPRVKGRKVKGGRAVTLRNFTGTIVKKSDGTVGILGRGRRK